MDQVEIQTDFEGYGCGILKDEISILTSQANRWTPALDALTHPSTDVFDPLCGVGIGSKNLRRR